MAVPDHLLFSAIWGIFGGGMQDKIGKLLETSLRISTGDPLHRRRARFVTGDQVAIPDWADRFFLGWLFASSRNRAQIARNDSSLRP